MSDNIRKHWQKTLHMSSNIHIIYVTVLHFLKAFAKFRHTFHQHWAHKWQNCFKMNLLKSHFWNSKTVGRILLKTMRSERCKLCTSCRPRHELSNEHFVANISTWRLTLHSSSLLMLRGGREINICFDTAVNERLKVWRWFNSFLQCTP